MAKKMYIGVDGKSRKVKKMYIGVDGKSRKIKKAYIGVDGKSRCIYSIEGLEYYGTIDNYKVRGCGNKAGTSFNGYAIFGAGSNMAGVYNTVYAYDSNLTENAIYSNMDWTSSMATSTDNFAIFAGGHVPSDHTTFIVYQAVNKAIAFDNNLSEISVGTLDKARVHGAAASINNNAIIAGGQYYNENQTITYVTDVVDCYSGTNGTHSALNRIYYGCSHLTGTANSNYAIFAGGVDADSYAGDYWVTMYDTSLTRSSPYESSWLTTPRINAASVSTDNYSLIAGGYYYDDDGEEVLSSSVIDVYNTSGTKASLSISLSAARYNLAGVKLNNYIIFAGGQNISGTEYDVVDVYDTTTFTRTTGPALQQEKSYLCPATTGNYAIFVNGSNDANSSRYHDVFIVNE